MQTFRLKTIFLIRTLTKNYCRKIQTHQIYMTYPYWMILRNYCWYQKWLDSGKDSRMFETILLWKWHICYIDLTNYTSVRPSIIINLVHISKTLLNNPSESHLSGKKIRSHLLEILRSKNQSVEVFKGGNDKNTPFCKGILPYQNEKRQGKKRH